MTAVERAAEAAARRGRPMPTCERCDRPKWPWGRSVPTEVADGVCGMDCDGYRSEPLPDHLHPGEIERHVWVDAELLRDLLMMTTEGEAALARHGYPDPDLIEAVEAQL